MNEQILTRFTLGALCVCINPVGAALTLQKKRDAQRTGTKHAENIAEAIADLCVPTRPILLQNFPKLRYLTNSSPLPESRSTPVVPCISVVTEGQCM